MSFEMHIISIDSERYPALLRETPQPPKQLYVRGNLDLLHHPHLLAVVGSRLTSAYSKQCINELLTAVASAQIPIVSGLALGIDSMAHRLCVELKAQTIAVLGSGIDDLSIYPRSHITLAKHILETGGTLVTEYPPGTAAYKGHFPARNRIIAGLCCATIIIQAKIHSGSLITARHALEANRDVGAVPGAITDPLSAGTNQLIRYGATPITCAADIFELMRLPLPQEASSLPDVTLEQAYLLSMLSHEPLHIDDIVSAGTLPAQHVASMLLELELSNYVQHVGGMKYVRKSAVGQIKTVTFAE